MRKHVKLIIMIIAIILLTSIGIYIGINQYKSNDLKNLSTNLLQIQAKTKNIKEKSIVENNENLLIGQTVSEDLIEKFNLENTDKIRILTQDDLNMLGLSNIKEDRKYIVNYNNGEVYYIDGYVTKEGEIYYNLSDINNISEQ